MVCVPEEEGVGKVLQEQLDCKVKRLGSRDSILQIQEASEVDRNREVVEPSVAQRVNPAALALKGRFGSYRT